MCMPSKNKLIKQGIKYTDSLFDEISKRLEKGVKASDTLEAFLEKTAGYTSGNPLVESGYYDKMMKLILQETNNHKFSRPAQKELVRLTIENRVGDLITDVGEDVRDSVREIVKDGYNNNLSQDEIATNISEKVSSIKGKRAKAIARTEIARTATISDYIINKERGATHFYVECRNTACPICKEAWHKHWSKANDESFTPKDSSAGGKGWIGDRTYSMKDTAMLPPIHVNCRCVPYFISEDDVEGEVEPVLGRRPTTTTTTETVESNSQYYKSDNGVIVDDMGISSKGYKGIKNFADAYATSNTEHGFIMDMETGKIYSPTFHGGKGEVKILEVSKTGESYVKSDNCVAVHNHPVTGYRIFSTADLEITLKSDRINHCIAVSGEDVWILKVNKDTPLNKISEIVDDYDRITSKVKSDLADDVVKRTHEILEKYPSGEKRREALHKLNEYMESQEYTELCQKRMNETVVKEMQKHSDYVSFKQVKTNDLANVSNSFKDVSSDNVKSVPKPQKQVKETNSNLTAGQQAYIDSLESELDRLTKERDRLIKTRAPDSKIREVIGKRGMVELQVNSAKRHIRNNDFDKIPSIEKESTPKTTQSDDKFSTKIKENGKEYRKWVDDKDMTYEEKKEYQSAISKHYEEVQDTVNYTEDELYGLLDYQKNSSTDINKLLIFGDSFRKTWDKFSKALNKGIDEKISNIKSAINKTPTLQENTILYTGQRLPDNVLDGEEIGEFKHFASTSFNERIGKQFSQRDERYNIKILAPKGTKGIVYTEQWRGRKVNKGTGEGELLLQAGTKFRVIKIDKKTKTATIELIV